MVNHPRYSVSILLILSMALLASLVPGGPIESRDFSHINAMILGAFNIFLTALGIGSLLLVYFVINRTKWAYLVAAFCGLGYFLVYALDLGKLFPVSPSSMSPALFSIEVIGLLISIPLMVFSLQRTLKPEDSHLKNGKERSVQLKPFIYLTSFLVLAGIGIVIFATRAAIGN